MEYKLSDIQKNSQIICYKIISESSKHGRRVIKVKGKNTSIVEKSNIPGPRYDSNKSFYNNVMDSQAIFKSKLFETEIHQEEKDNKNTTDLSKHKLEGSQLIEIKDNEGKSVLVCGNCKSTNYAIINMQTRSLDEGGTTYGGCHDCGNKWSTR